MRKDYIIRKKPEMAKIIIHSVLVLYSLCCIIPILIIISTSLSSETEILKNGYGLLPKGFTLFAYKTILNSPMTLVRAYGVTTLVSSIGVVCGLWLTASLGYILYRKDFKWSRQLSFYVFLTMVFNGGLVPFYIVVSVWLGLKDNILSLILPYLVNPWFVLLIKGFMKSIPHSLIESSKIDGAGELRIFVKIVLPICKPALATVGLFLLLQYWNDWWLSMLFINKEGLFTLQYMLVRILNNIQFMSEHMSLIGATAAKMRYPDFSARFAMCILAAGPMLFIFMFFQKYFASGIMVGSIKE